MMLQIRPATADDVATLVALMTAFYAEANYPLPPAPATRAFHTLLAEPQLGGVWLAEDAATAVGHVVLTLSYSMEYGGMRGFIDDLYVRPEARGRGIGAAMLAAVRSACVDRGGRAMQTVGICC
jgi:GNAT superfamily N-acetyltransferase